MSDDNLEHKMEFNTSTNDASPLSRQMTVTLSPEQYERLFFQPGQPKGDFSRRFGNPTLLGLFCFLVPYSSTIFILCGFQGAVPPTSLIGLDGDYYFIGAIGMVLAGLAEFVLGNTFPFAVFTVFGVHWGSLAYAQDPWHQQLSAFVKVGGAAGVEWNASQGLHNVTMCILSVILFIAAFRVNVLFVLVFLGLIFLFAFIAAADFAVPHATTAADVDHILMLLKVGGGFGMLGVICGWYLALITACESVGMPCPLPIFDLTSRVFPEKKKEHAV